MKKVTVLAASSIKEEEDFTGFIVRQCELSNVDNHRGLMSLLGKHAHRPAFLHPSRIEDISALFPSLLPDWERIVMKHTRYPLYSAFLNRANKKRLLLHHRSGQDTSAHRLIGMNRLPLRGRLGICLSCVESDLELHGFATWHRAHLMPSIFYCPTHAEPLFTFCQHCELGHRRARRTWFPRPDCLCGKPLRQIASLASSESIAAAIAISKMADDVLRGQIDTSIFAENVAPVIRAQLQRNIDAGLRDYSRRAKEYLEIRLGPDLCSALDFSAYTLKRAIGIKTSDGPLTNPIQNIATIWSVFKGWPTFLREVQARHADHAKYDASTRPAPIRIRMNVKRDRRAESLHQIGSMSAAELAAYRARNREQILALISARPSLSRSDLSKSPGGGKLHFFATQFDTPWFDEALPSRRNGFQSPMGRQRVQTASRKATSLVLCRYEQTVRQNPERFITRSFLLTGIANESIYRRRWKQPELEAMLARCIDTFETWSRRQITNVSSSARKFDPHSKWAARETFEGLSPRHLSQRLYRARIWLKKHQG
ncbi:hypothetical protein DF147_23495 [Burkholderia cenocepacia]|nr:hypothetical protein DF147_23495 [Burkholderia cenocepacia]